MAAPFGAAISQQARAPHTLTLRIDNDAFDFWMLPWNRPDEEYTSGVHVSYDGGDAPRWARHSLRGRRPCTVLATSCRGGGLEIGQDIYTPSVSVDEPRVAPNSRPSGGWLYLSQAARALDVTTENALTVALGVTGPPSLARFTQRIAHAAAPQFNRPTDWSRQIAFEPGALIRFEHQRRFAASVAPDGAFGFDVIPRLDLTAGNILTAAEAGVRMRSGWHLSHPWLVSAPAPGISVFAGVSGRAVARDIFLDGNSFAEGPRVGHEPLIGAGEAGIDLRFGPFDVGYRAVNETRAWSRGPKWHPWASLVGGITFDR